MARPHHRKKHKQHVQQFKQRTEGSKDAAKSSATSVFSIGTAFFGFAIGYIASSGNLVWMMAGLVLGAIAGYLVGRRIDASAK